MAMTALGSGHLVVKVFEDVLVALVHGAGDEQHVGVLRIADVHDAEAFDVEDGREAASTSMSHLLQEPQS